MDSVSKLSVLDICSHNHYDVDAALDRSSKIRTQARNIALILGDGTRSGDRRCRCTDTTEYKDKISAYEKHIIMYAASIIKPLMDLDVDPSRGAHIFDLFCKAACIDSKDQKRL